MQTFRAYHCLVAISGNVDRPGGNMRLRTPKGFRNYLDLLHDPEFRLDAETEQRTIGADRYPLWAGPKGWQTACHNPSVIEAMLTGRPYPVRALYASGVNILVTYPDTRRTMEALRRLEFVAVAAHAMTPTAEFADIVLPKTTTLEEEEVSFMPSGPTVLFTRAVVPPQGEARTELDIARPLLEKMAARQALTKHLVPWPTQRAFNTYLLGDSGIRIEELERTGYHQVSAAPVTPAGRPFKTPTGKIELFSTTLEGLGLDPLPACETPARERLPESVRADYPLILVTGDREKSYHHSRFRDQGWALKVSPDPRLTVHPGYRARPWYRRGRLGAAGGCPWCGRVPAARQALRRDAAGRGQHGDGLVAAVGAGARARRARHQHQCGARLRRPVRSRLRLLRHPRPPLPPGADRGVSGPDRRCHPGACHRDPAIHERWSKPIDGSRARGPG